MWNKGLCMIYPYLINAWLSLQLELNKSPGHYLRIFLSTYVISASVHSYCAFAKSEFEIFLEILEIQVWDWCNEKQTVLENLSSHSGDWGLSGIEQQCS